MLWGKWTSYLASKTGSLFSQRCPNYIVISILPFCLKLIFFHWQFKKCWWHFYLQMKSHVELKKAEEGDSLSRWNGVGSEDFHLLQLTDTFHWVFVSITEQSLGTNWHAYCTSLKEKGTMKLVTGMWAGQASPAYYSKWFIIKWVRQNESQGLFHRNRFCKWLCSLSTWLLVDVSRECAASDSLEIFVGIFPTIIGN